MNKKLAALTCIPNPIGIPLCGTEISGILNPTNEIEKVKREDIEAFFNLIPTEISRPLLIRYVLCHRDIKHIKLGTNMFNIYKKLIFTMKSALRCFCYEEVLATIELSGLLGEMLTSYLCIAYSNKIITNENILKYKTTINNNRDLIALIDRLMQSQRIKILNDTCVITEGEAQDFQKLHDIRKVYYHHWSKSFKQIESDALLALNNISIPLAKHLEMGDDEEIPNVTNFSAIIDYIKIYPEEG